MEDARWFTKQEIAAGLKSGTFRLPPPISISFSLIQEWFDQDADHKLQELL
jgi:NAD+ diphosphatase